MRTATVVTEDSAIRVVIGTGMIGAETTVTGMIGAGMIGTGTVVVPTVRHARLRQQPLRP